MRSASDEDDMSVSGTRSAAETDLEEFERRLRAAATQLTSAEDALLVEWARRLAPARSSPHAQAVSEPGRTDTKPTQPTLRPSIDEVPDDRSETATVEIEAKQAYEFDDSSSHDPNEAELATEQGSGGWNLKVSALALGGVAIIGAIFDLTRGPPVAATVNTPIVAALIGAPPPAASQFPDPKTERSVSLRPDGTPIATWSSSATNSGMAAQTSDAAKPAKPPSKAGKFTARVVVAKADTAAPASAAETPVQLAAPAKPEKAAKAAPKAPQAAAAPPAAPPAPRAPAQEPANPLARAFGELVGALVVPATSARQPVDPPPATTSSGWAVQLAAPKSETEAKSDAARLNAKYASALKGAAIGVHKTQANGATAYRLRVVGLSKADAAALCARLKAHGGDCFSLTTLISTSP